MMENVSYLNEFTMYWIQLFDMDYDIMDFLHVAFVINGKYRINK
jgi:hypothetical protein